MDEYNTKDQYILKLKLLEKEIASLSKDVGKVQTDLCELKENLNDWFADLRNNFFQTTTKTIVHEEKIQGLLKRIEEYSNYLEKIFNNRYEQVEEMRKDISDSNKVNIERIHKMEEEIEKLKESKYWIVAIATVFGYILNFITNIFSNIFQHTNISNPK